MICDSTEKIKEDLEKMKKFAKILCIVLCVALLAGILSVVSFAAEITVQEPMPDKAFKLGCEQGNLSKTLYFAGTTANADYYLKTTENYEEAADVYVEEVDGGYRLYFYGANDVKTYIDAYKNGTHYNLRLTTAPTAVFTYNYEYNTMTTTVEDGTEVYIGTYSTYNTLSCSKLSYIATSFPCHLYAEEEEVIPPAGPVDVQLPGNLEYTFETDDAAVAGVIFQWTADANGELSVPRMIAGGAMYAMVTINGGYDYEFGMNGYIVKAGDLVEITVYANAAGSLNEYIDFIAEGGADNDQVGSAQNPEIITSLNAGIEKTLSEGEYHYQYIARKAGELVINTNGDGSHNMNVTINGDNSVVYSNWDHDGAYVSVNVAEGDVVDIVVYFDFGAGTISFDSAFDAGDVIVPEEPNPGTGDAIFAVLSLLSVSGMGIAVVASKKR